MNTAEYHALCRGVQSGGEHYVVDRATQRMGKVTDCQGNWFEVQVDNEMQTWPSASCQEKWGVSR